MDSDPVSLTSPEALAVDSKLLLLLDKAITALELCERTRARVDVEQAVAAWWAVLTHEAFARSAPEVRARSFTSAADAITKRYELSDSTTDRNEAIALLQLAVDHTPRTSVSLPRRLNTLGAALRRRYGSEGDIAGLDRAVQAYQDAVALVPQGSSERPSMFSSLGLGYRDRFVRTGDRADLDRAVEACERSVAEASLDARWRRTYLHNLAAVVQLRFETIGDPADGERSRDVRAAADMLVSNQGDLVDALWDEYRKTDQLADLNRVIDAVRSAVANIDTPAVAAMQSSNLGYLLDERFRRTGDLADLDEAVQTTERAADAFPSTMPGRALVLTHLAGALRRRFTVTTEVDDINRAVKIYREALNSAEADDARFRYLCNLANGLADRHDRIGTANDLDEAIALYEQALDGATPSISDRILCQQNLAVALRDRYRKRHEIIDLHRAIDGLNLAASQMPPEAVERPGLLNNLASCFAERHAVTHDESDMNSAVAAYRDSCRSSLRLAPGQTLVPARQWGKWASSRQSWREAAEAYQFGVESMQRLFASHTSRRHKEQWLRQAEGLPALAAYASAKVGDLERAVVAIEQGRALLLAETLVSSTDTDEIRARAGLAATPAPELSNTEPVAQPSGSALAYLIVVDDGALVLIANATPTPSLTADWLPELTEASLQQHVRRFYEAYFARRERPDAWLATLDSTTEWTWTSLMGPMTQSLPSVAALVLVPMGLLTLLPLHAAWRPDDTTPTGRHYLLDELLVSYAPNARAHQAATRLASRCRSDSVLVIDDPQPVAAPQVPYSSLEAEAAIEAVSRHRRLRKQKATREAVLNALADYAVLHFACHGVARPDDPLVSALIMAGNQPLTLRDVMAKHLPATRLAVLSACETSLPGLDLPDEVINLPTGFLQAGVAGVVGSMWSVAAESTPLVMARLYESWRQDGLEPAAALRQAQQWVRDTTNGEKAARFPQLDEIAGRAIPPRAQRFWANARSHDHPYHWAAFTYSGA